MDDGKKFFYADLSLLITAFIWGAAFIATKNALSSNIKPFYIMALRFGIASIILMIIFWKRVKKINKDYLKAGSIIGIFLFAGYALQTIGLQYTYAGKQAFLTGTNVVIVPFITWFITREKPDIYSFVSVVLAFLGIGFLTLDNGIHINFGDFLTLLCAVCFAAHIVLVGELTKNRDPIILTIIQLGFTAAASIFCSLLFEPAPEKFDSKGIIAVLYLGIFSTMIAFLIQNVAQKYTNPIRASIMLCMESVFGFILSVIVLKEVFTFRMVVGCIMIFIGIIVSETKLSFLKPKCRERS